MRTSQKYSALFILVSIVLSACTSPAGINSSAQTPHPTATSAGKPSAQESPTPAVSRLNVGKEALRGAQVTVWHPWFGAEAGLFESQVAQFNADNEWGVVVRAEGKSSFGELFSQVSAAFEESDNPNVAIVLPEYALAWRERVVDLNDYLRDPEYGMSSVEISEFPTAIWMQDETEGARLGMPAQRTGRFILYNRTWARELGFDSPPETSAEFERQACAANKALASDADANNDALGGWLVDVNPMTPLSWMLAFGGGVESGGGYHFLAQENIDAFRFVKSLQQKSCAWVASAEISTYDRFASRQALFATASLEEFADQSRAFNALGSDDQWTVLPFPGNDRTAFVVYGSSFVAFESDDVTQLAAWLFIRWMLSAENQARWAQSTGMFPLRSSTMNLLADYSASHPQWKQAVELLPNGETTPKLSSWRLVKIMMQDGFRDMFDTIRHPDLTEGQVPLILRQMDEIANELNQ